MKRIFYLLTALLLLVGCKTKKEDRIIAVSTYVDHVVLNKIKDSFVEEMQGLGYTEKNGWKLIIKNANGQPDEANAVADELLNMNPKVIVSISTPSTKPVYDKNKGQIPHVYSFVSFPESIGIKNDSKNTTGLSDGVDFAANYKLIKELVPNMKKLGMVYSDEPNAVISKNEMLRLSKENGVIFIGQSVSKEDEVKQACQSIADADVDAIIVGADGVVVNQINAMIEVANAKKIPLFAMDEGSVENGALGALSVNYEKFGKATAILTDKVIKNGSTKGIEPAKYYGKDIVVNLKTCDLIGVKIPENIIKKAYKVIR